MSHYEDLTEKQLIDLLEDADDELDRLRTIEDIARRFYKALRGTMAAQGPSGLALKEALGED